MKRVTIDTYKFSELSEDAREKARAWFREGREYCWQEENRATLDAFIKVFPVTVKNWEYGGRCDINYRIDCDDEIRELSGIRLLKYIINNYGSSIFKKEYLGHLKGKDKFSPVYSHCQTSNCCVLTGYCLDDDILAPIYAFLKKPSDSTTFEDLMNDCLWSWVHACDRDIDNQNTDAFIDEEINANEYDFTIDGNRF